MDQERVDRRRLKKKGRRRDEGKVGKEKDASKRRGVAEAGSMAAEPRSERAEGDTSQGNAKKDTTVENSSGAERDRAEGKPQPSRPKKCKRERDDDAAEASADDPSVPREDKKRRIKEPPGVLEETESSSEGENGEVKVRGAASPGSSGNAFASPAGEEADAVGNVGKKKRVSKEGTGGEMKEKENSARPKNKGSKRVSFADSVEVFRTEGGDGEGIEPGKKKKKAANKGSKRVSLADSDETVFGGEGGSGDESKFVHGQRFTPEEDATLMEAIRSFVEMKQLGDKGLEMIRSPRKHPELRRCWDVIGKSLPHRPHNAIYRRAHILLNRSDERKWTQEEKEYIRR